MLAGSFDFWCGALLLMAMSVPLKAEETEDRVANARAAAEPVLRELCGAKAIPYPPRAVFLRAFKDEARLEVWARGEEPTFQLLASFAITASSGEPGPKRREGDRQVPEGFYLIDAFNPASRFHLSLRVNYPNESDRILSKREAPGSDIYVHGSDRSIGCLALGDDAIERLYILLLDFKAATQADIPIHIFPARMEGAKWTAFVQKHTAGHEDRRQFWTGLGPGYEFFEQKRQVPQVTVDSTGAYRLAP